MTPEKDADTEQSPVAAPSISEGDIQAFASRLMLVIPLGLGIWATLRGLKYGAPANYLTLLIAMTAVLAIGPRRPLTGAALMVVSGIAEWLARTQLSVLTPFPVPLGSILLTTAALILIEAKHPTLAATNLIDDLAQDDGKFWRLMVLVTPVLLAMLIGLAKIF